MTSKTLRAVSILVTLGLAVTTVLNEVVRDKKIQEEIVKEVAKAVANK